MVPKYRMDILFTVAVFKGQHFKYVDPNHSKQMQPQHLVIPSDGLHPLISVSFHCLLKTWTDIKQFEDNIA